MKKWFYPILFLGLLSFLWFPLLAESQHGHKSKPGEVGSAASGTPQMSNYPSMPGPGKKVPIGADYYFIYGFDKKPKLGQLIMKVELFTKEGKKDTSMEVKAEAGMPSMRGAHETGEQLFAPETVEHLQKLIKEKSAPKRTIETPVLEYA